MLYCDNYNVKVSKWWYVYKKSRSSGNTATAVKNELERGYSMDTKPWVIRSARNAAGLSVLTR